MLKVLRELIRFPLANFTCYCCIISFKGFECNIFLIISGYYFCVTINRFSFFFFTSVLKLARLSLAAPSHTKSDLMIVRKLRNLLHSLWVPETFACAFFLLDVRMCINRLFLITQKLGADNLLLSRRKCPHVSLVC